MKTDCKKTDKKSSKIEQQPLPNVSVQGAELRGKRKTAREQKHAKKSNKDSKENCSPEKSSKMNLADAVIQVTQRLQEIQFILSPSQPNTPGDGD